VPLRVDACHCGVTREQAALQAEAARATDLPRPEPSRGPRALRPPLPRDVKALLVASAVVVVVGLGWLFFAPRPEPLPALLGHVDVAPPPPPKPTPPPRPPFKLPWWK